jgi:hypothetical protein
LTKIILSISRICLVLLELYFVYLFLYCVWAYRIQPLQIFYVRGVIAIVGVFLAPAIYFLVVRWVGGKSVSDKF